MDTQKTTSPHKRRSKHKKNVSTVSTSTNTSLNNENNSNNAIKTAVEPNSAEGKKSPILADKSDKTAVETRHSQDKLQIVNERQSLKLAKTKRNSTSSSLNATAINVNSVEDEEDSENEKLSPLLSPGSKSQNSLKMSKKLSQTESASLVGAISNDDHDGVELEMQCSSASLDKAQKRASVNNDAIVETTTKIEEDSDYYTPEDTNNSILSPLCPDKIAIKSNATNAADKITNLKPSSGSFRSANNLAKKNLHKKSTSVGNILGPTGATSNELKVNVSSLPGKLKIVAIFSVIILKIDFYRYA